MNLLFKLLGVKGIENGEIVRWRPYWNNLKTRPQELLMLLVAIALGYGVWWFYKREPDYCSLRKRRFLAGLRTSALMVLLVIICGPMIEVFVRSVVKGKVVILVDASKSM